jgi:hypothetical protein
MAPLVLGEDEIQQLQAFAKSRSLQHSIVRPAQIVLACGASGSNTTIAKRVGLTGMTVGKWRKRYLEQGLYGMHVEISPGGPNEQGEWVHFGCGNVRHTPSHRLCRHCSAEHLSIKEFPW